MKLSLNRESLVAELEILEEITEPRTGIPQVENVELEARASGVLFISASNMEVAVISRLRTVAVEEPGQCTVPLNVLSSALSGTDSVLLEMFSEDSIGLALKAGPYRSMVYHAMPWVSLPDFGEDSCVDLPLAVLRPAIRATSFAICEDESRFLMNGAYMGAPGGRFVLAATNGDRLSVGRGEIGFDLKPFIIRKLALELLCLDEGTVVSYLLRDRWHTFRGESRTVMSRLMEGTFPKFEPVLDVSPCQVEVIVDTACLRTAVSVAGRFPEPDGFGHVSLRFVGSELRVRSIGSELGLAETLLEVEPLTGEGDVEAHFNPAYVSDVLDAAVDAGFPRLRICITSQGAALFMPSDGSAQWLVMPLKVNSL